MAHWKERAQLAGWLIFFGWMIARGFHVAYLAQLQSRILLVGAAILALAFLAHWPRTVPKFTTDYRAWLETAGHFLPIAIFLIMGATSLTLSDSGLGGANIRVLMPDAQDLEFDPGQLQPGEYYKTSMTDLYSVAGLENDAPVELVGRLYILRTDEAEKHFPDRTPLPKALFYRYAIACCAADASPVATILEMDDMGGHESGDWLKIRGRTAFDDNGRRNQMIVLHGESIQSVPQPARPYLSWLESLR